MKPLWKIVFLVLFILYSFYNVLHLLQSKVFFSRPVLEDRKFLFCLILTTPNNLKTKALSVNKWAIECDKYYFVTKINSSVLVNASHEFTDPLPILQPAYHVNETYGKLTDKVLKAFRDVYLRHSDYDFYFKCDDDTFVFVDNLKDFLKTKNSSLPVSYGHDFKMRSGRYHSGGAGYVLSNEALIRLGRKLVENYTFCENTGVEDVDVAKCLRRLDVYPDKSTDELGRERFHPFYIDVHLKGRYSNWYLANAANPIKNESFSDTSISFHYMSPKQIDKLQSLYLELKRNFSKPYNLSSILFQMID